MKFVKLSNQISKLEENVLSIWDKQNVFKRSIEERPIDKQFVLYDGPPFATGLPHYGHILAHSIKDVFPRYQTMKGFRVERRFGWDCHGVPVEHQVEKEQMIKDSADIEGRYGIKEFNDACRAIVMRCSNEWRFTEKRLGRFVDMENDYKTMNPQFIESVWAVFKKLHEKGLIYEDNKIVAYSPTLGTPFSDFESKLNYKEVEDPSITMQFPLADEPGTSLLVWTTTPWSVPSNVAIAMNEDIEYVKINLESGQSFILAKDQLDNHFSKDQIIGTELVQLDSLIGKKYLPMFETLTAEESEKAYCIVKSKHVSATDGTGLVHISPMHGEDDFAIGKREDLPKKDFADKNCVFSIGLPRYSNGDWSPDFIKGKSFKEADTDLIEYMIEKNRIYRNEKVVHQYPFCWRTEQPLMYRAVPSWYVEVTAIKDRIIENNKKITWYPDWVGSNRFNNWLENSRDWSISRNRFWGSPIPIWRNVDDPTDILVIGSKAELEQYSQKLLDDLHRDNIDDIVIEKDGKIYKRIEQVFDCWFESGSMPYAQNNYLFDNDEEFLKHSFPADFIAEGLDQTRGWFYTLLVLSTALFDKPAFKNCVVNGILLGDDGKKMSKSKGNFPDINTVLEKYGADAMRFALLSSLATCAQELAVSEGLIKLQIKTVLLPMLNIYNFFAQQANLANFQSRDGFSYDSLKSPVNQWIFYKVEKFISEITNAYDNYDLVKSCKLIEEMISLISNEYLHYGRHLFEVKSGVMNELHIESFQVLHHAIERLSFSAAPVMPFIADALFMALHGNELSVHLHYWPEPLIVQAYEVESKNFETLCEIFSLVNKIRSEKEIRARQPLSCLYLHENMRDRLMPNIDFLMKSTNVKSVKWLGNDDEMYTNKISLNSNILGQKYRKEYQEIRRLFLNNQFEFSNGILNVGGYKLSLEDKEFSVSIHCKAGIASAKLNDVSLFLDLEMNESLIKEGFCNDFRRLIQDSRKKAHYEKSFKATVYVSSELAKFFGDTLDVIGNDTKTAIIISDNPDSENCLVNEMKLGGFVARVTIPFSDSLVLENKSFLFGNSKSDSPYEENHSHDFILG